MFKWLRKKLGIGALEQYVDNNRFYIKELQERFGENMGAGIDWGREGSTVIILTRMPGRGDQVKVLDKLYVKDQNTYEHLQEILLRFAIPPKNMYFDGPIGGQHHFKERYGRMYRDRFSK